MSEPGFGRQAFIVVAFKSADWNPLLPLSNQKGSNVYSSNATSGASHLPADLPKKADRRALAAALNHYSAAVPKGELKGD